ncbi:22423_t:CDS:2, partial [Gigaspora rosea]
GTENKKVSELQQKVKIERIAPVSEPMKKYQMKILRVCDEDNDETDEDDDDEIDEDDYEEVSDGLI